MPPLAAHLNFNSIQSSCWNPQLVTGTHCWPASEPLAVTLTETYSKPWCMTPGMPSAPQPGSGLRSRAPSASPGPCTAPVSVSPSLSDFAKWETRRTVVLRSLTQCNPLLACDNSMGLPNAACSSVWLWIWPNLRLQTSRLRAGVLPAGPGNLGPGTPTSLAC